MARSSGTALPQTQRLQEQRYSTRPQSSALTITETRWGTWGLRGKPKKQQDLKLEFSQGDKVRTASDPVLHH